MKLDVGSYISQKTFEKMYLINNDFWSLLALGPISGWDYSKYFWS